MHILIAALHRPTKPTGVCRHAANLAECLADTEQVNRVTLVIGVWQKDYFQTSFNLSSKKIKIVYIDIKNSSFSRNAWFMYGLAKLAKQLKSDIIHHSFPLPFIRSLCSCPVVTTIHDLYPYEFPENFGYPNVLFNQLFLKQCIQNSDGLSCVSHQTSESLTKFFPYVDKHKKTAVVYNYVDFSNVEPRVPQNISYSINTPFLLAVAQHRKNKNLNILIQSYSLLLKNNYLQSIKLVLVGSPGPETENLCNLIDTLSLKDSVHMLSSIDDEELCWLYKNCKLLVIPSSTEGFCLPLAEALYLGCKVVCSDIPIFKEIGNLNCTYFNLESEPVKNLTEAIHNIIQTDLEKTSPDYRFSKEKVAFQYLNLYSALK